MAILMDLGFAESAIAIKSFDLRLDLRVDVGSLFLSMRLGTVAERGSPFLLSNDCAAFVHENRLLGFLIRLS